MVLRSIIASVLAVGTAVAVSAGSPSSPVHPPSACPVVSSRPVSGVAAAIRQGPLVARSGQLAAVGGPAIAVSTRAGDGAVRHVASDPQHGVVYVRDLPGGDDIVADTPAGSMRLHRPSEVSHPSWMPNGDIVWGEGSRLHFWSHLTGAFSSSRPPVRGGLVFSPIARTARWVFAAVVEPLNGVPTEDERLSNLWRYDARGGGWQQVTRFHATADRWSIIRTPQIGPDGIEFIRVHGTASGTQEPTFELWSLRGGDTRLEAVLPGERYLAGYRDGVRLWNLPSVNPVTWVLARETNGGALQVLGCGAVAVDPVDVPDPDRVSPAAPTAQDPNYPIPPPSPQPPAHEVAILVGDYSGESGATNAAQQIIASYGLDAQVKVVDSDAAPTALKPGAWGAIMWIGAQADPAAAIQRFWDRLPQFADRSWVVAP